MPDPKGRDVPLLGALTSVSLESAAKAATYASIQHIVATKFSMSAFSLP